MPKPLRPGLQLQPLPYHDRLPLRDPSSLAMVVIHCTELPDLATAREYGERVLYDSGAGNSGHFYIDRDGVIREIDRRVSTATAGQDIARRLGELGFAKH